MVFDLILARALCAGLSGIGEQTEVPTASFYSPLAVPLSR